MGSFITSIFQIRRPSTERLSNFPKTTQLGSDRIAVLEEGLPTELPVMAEMFSACAVLCSGPWTLLVAIEHLKCI